MDAAAELAEFLKTRRAGLTPEQVGLPTYGIRRVKGLRREEVASLAGVSLEYYKRLERGNASGVSDTVLDSLARGLRLDDAERTHLFDLARAANPGAPRGRRHFARQVIRPGLRQMLDSINGPATLSNGRGDYLAANGLGRVLYAPLFDSRAQPPNSARFTFLDATSQEFFIDWEHAARDLVAHLRSEAGRNPYDQALADLIGELSTRSEPFRKWWADHNVQYHQTGSKRLRHPIVGDLELNYEVMPLPADGLRLAIFTAEPGSTSDDSLRLLASWSATAVNDDATSARLTRRGRDAS